MARDGLNLAIAYVWRLSRVIAECCRSASDELLDRFSDECLQRVWRAQHFSWWMTSILHLTDTASPFDHRRQLAELEYVTSSRAAMTSVSENYFGLPIT